jgi:cobalt-zinc-cadmium efflux system outer membrane protein
MRNYFLILSLFFSFQSFGQSLEQCENKLQNNNLLLKSLAYDVEISVSKALQSSIRSLPIAETSINGLNPESSRLFDGGRNGQKTLGISQTIYTGQKKIKERKYFDSEIKNHELNLFSVLAELKFNLKENYFRLYFAKQQHKIITEQSQHTDSLLGYYTTQANRGNIPYKDVARLQSLSLSLLNQILLLNQDILHCQSNLKTLLQTDQDIEPTLKDTDFLSKYINNNLIVESRLLDSAEKNNITIQQARHLLQSAELALQWQKSLAIPNFEIGTAYDQRGGAFSNEVNLTLVFPIPLWNQNKGNIDAAKTEVLKAKTLGEHFIKEQQTKIKTAYLAFLNHKEKYLMASDVNINQMSEIYLNYLTNIRKRNITLIEFIDFAEGYYQSRLLLNQLRLNLILSGEEINFLTYSNIF